MKLVILTRDLGLGGVERCVALVSEGLAARGVSVEIVMLGGNRNLWGKHLAGIKVHDLSSVWHGKKPWTWLAGWRAVHRIVADADVVLAATFLMPLYMGWLATRFLPARFLGWIHGPLAELDAFARMNPVHRVACQFIYRRMDELVCVSEHSRQSLARWLGVEAKSGWRVLPNFVAPAAPRTGFEPPFIKEGQGGLSETENPPQSSLAKGGDSLSRPLQLLFVGRIAIEKQPHLWLDTLEALAARGLPAELTVLGEGPLQNWLQAEAAGRGLSTQLHLIGHIGGVEDYMRRADWLLLTSNFEGFGLVVLEAMQVGLPVVTTDSGGVCDFFAGRQDDFVTKEATGAALADRIAAHLPNYQAISTWGLARSHDYAPARMLAGWVRILDGKD